MATALGENSVLPITVLASRDAHAAVSMEKMNTGEHGGRITYLDQLKDESFTGDNMKIALLLKSLLTVLFGFDSYEYNKSSKVLKLIISLCQPKLYLGT